MNKKGGATVNKTIEQEAADQPKSASPILNSHLLKPTARVATIGLFCLGMLFALHEAASLLAPMSAAIVAGVVLSRIIDNAQARGIPTFVVATSFVVAIGAGIWLAASAVSSRLSTIVDRAPEIASRFSALAANFLKPLQSLKAQISGTPAADHAPAAAPSIDMGAITGVLSGVTPALGGVLIFLATLFFFVAGKAELRRKIVMAYDKRESRLSALRILNGVEEALAHYFGSATLIYGALAAITSLGAWAAGLGPPALWGVFVFVACFIPFLGVALVAAALLAAGLSTYDTLFAGIAPAIAYLLVHMALENAVLPAIVGRRFEVNSFSGFHLHRLLDVDVGRGGRGHRLTCVADGQDHHRGIARTRSRASAAELKTQKPQITSAAFHMSE